MSGRASSRRPAIGSSRFAATPVRSSVRAVVAPQPVLDALASGTRYWFSDWPNLAVPRASGVYTIWDGETLLYVGLARTNGGLASLLRSHASGRRSRDQFCIYVADRLVLPMLTRAEIRAIAAGELSFDALVRDYIHERLWYRFAEIAEVGNCYAVESEIRRGGLAAGAPLLNP
jgi:hypothetical protein